MRGFIQGFFSLLLFGSSISAKAIVNVESLRNKKGSGTQHQSEVKSSAASGNSENFRAELAHVTAWQWSQSQLFAVLDYNYGESRQVKDTNQFFSHLRQAIQLPRSSSQLELFAQWQYNQFQRLNSRFLSGSGLREALYQGEQLRIHLGFGAFWYREQIASKGIFPEQKEEGGRFNTYLAVQWSLDKSFSVFNTLYFQPHMKKIKDHHVLWDLQLSWKLTKVAALTANWTLAHDNAAPAGIKTTDSSYLLGLKFTY